MGNPIYVIAYDVGTTGVKTCLFSITDKIELLGAASEGYNLYVYPDGGAEQDPDECELHRVGKQVCPHQFQQAGGGLCVGGIL